MLPQKVLILLLNFLCILKALEKWWYSSMEEINDHAAKITTYI